MLLPLIARSAVTASGFAGPGAADGGKGSWRAVWTYTLLLTVAIAFTPVLWPLAALLGLAALAVRRAAWKTYAPRLAATLAVPPLVLAPWSLGLFTHPAALLREAGLAHGSGAASALDLLGISPGGPRATAGLLLLGIVVAALAALLREERRSAVVTAWAVALAALLLAVLVNRTGWAGPATLVYGLALLAAAAVGADGAKERVAARSFGWRQPLAALIALAAAAGPLLLAAGWMLGGADGPLERRDPVQVPAFVAEESGTRDQARTLVLGGGSAAQVHYTLVRGSGGRLGDAELAATAGSDTRLDKVVSSLVAGSGADQSAQLGGFAIRYVLVRDGAPQQIRRVLDATPGLSRLSQLDGDALWRVDRQVARVVIVPGKAGEAPIPVASGPVEAHTKIGAGEAGRVLRIADRTAPGWRATLDGKPLKSKTVDGWAQGFELPAAGGRLDLVHADSLARTAWHWTQGALALLLLVMALPGRRRSLDDDLPDEEGAVPAQPGPAEAGEGRRARRLRAEAAPRPVPPPPRRPSPTRTRRSPPSRSTRTPSTPHTPSRTRRTQTRTRCTPTRATPPATSSSPTRSTATPSSRRSSRTTRTRSNTPSSSRSSPSSRTRTTRTPSTTPTDSPSSARTGAPSSEARPLTLAAVTAALAAVTGVAVLTAPAAPAAADAKARQQSAARLPVERSTLVCPAPSTSDIAETTYTTITPGKPGTSKGGARLTGATKDAKPLLEPKTPGTPVGASSTGAEAPALTGTADGALAPGWTAQQTTQVAVGQARGLLGVACTAPGTEFWFPGASTAKGRQDYVHLTNADDTPAVVDIQLFGPDGALKTEAGSGENIKIGPKSSVPVLLSTIAPGAQLADLTAHVTTRSGRVGASVQVAEEGVGADWLPASTDPAGSLVLPGIPADATSVRLIAYAPGEEDADLKLRLAGPGASITPAGNEQLHVKGGMSASVDLKDVTRGEAGSLVLTPSDGRKATPWWPRSGWSGAPAPSRNSASSPPPARSAPAPPSPTTAPIRARPPCR